jgi:peptidoglycan/xylan/chitin deacetylase (PgdA/CDA1 family)
MASPESRRAWRRELRSRFVAHWRLKGVVIPLFVTGFFAAYFQLLRYPVFPITVMPLHGVDRLIAFHPAAMLPYASLWLYVFLAPAFLRGRRELLGYAGAATALALIGLGIFFLWPTEIPRFEFDAARHPLFAFLQTVDAAGNACPSLHVAFAVFTAVWLERIGREVQAPAVMSACNALWCAAIVYSTLATKQHVFADVIAGVTLGAAVALLDPRGTAPADARAGRWPNRLTLALLVSGMGKATLLVLEPAQLHPALTVLLFFGPDAWIMTGLLVPNVSSLVPTATRFQTTRREVWLTIDDGPDPATTTAMLDLLERHGAKATFFLIGERAAAHPALVTAINARGHTIGNHTQTHPLADFWLAGPRRTAREIDACQSALQAAGGAASRWFRAPAGIRSFFLRGLLARRELTLIGWSARPLELWSSSVAGPLRRLRRNLRPGAILLIHESAAHGARRVALLAGLLEHLTTEGYACVLPEYTDLR